MVGYINLRSLLHMRCLDSQDLIRSGGNKDQSVSEDRALDILEKENNLVKDSRKKWP